jgi:hypothetical protein
LKPSNFAIRAHLAEGMEYALQQTDHDRPLDSLDTVIVQAYLAGEGIEIPLEARPNTNCIRGWLDWVDQLLCTG